MNYISPYERGPYERAEQLLYKVVPEEHIVKDGVFDDLLVVVHGKKYMYAIRQAESTLIYKKGKPYKFIGLACLEIQGMGRQPSPDRIVAEYLLIKNDEQRYLKTANLFWNNPLAHRPGRNNPVIPLVVMSVTVAWLFVDLIIELTKFLR